MNEIQPFCFKSELLEYYPSLDLVTGSIQRKISLMEPLGVREVYWLEDMKNNSRFRQFINEKFALVPYIELLLSHDLPPEFLTDAVQLFEEYSHRRFRYTLTGLKTSWIDGLSTIEVLKLLDITRTICEENKGFRLLIPLHKNLKRRNIPVEVKWKISNIIKSTKLLTYFAKTIVPIAEFLIIQELYALSKTQRLSFLKNYIKLKVKNFSKTYIQFKQFLPTQKFIQVLEELELDITNIIFSPKLLDFIPPLSLDSLSYSDEKLFVHRIKKHFKTLLQSPNNITKNSAKFFAYMKEHNCDFVYSQEDFEKIFLTFGISAETLSSSDPYFIYTGNMMYPILRDFDKMMDHINKSVSNIIDENQRGFIYQLLCYEGLGTPSLAFYKNPVGEYKLFFHKYDLFHPDELIPGIFSWILKYFLLQPDFRCPLFGISKACKRCIILNMKYSRSKSDGCIKKFLQGINVRQG
jgi:hypothetical protein